MRLQNGAVTARIAGTSLEKEPTTTDVLAKLPGMVLKDGKPQAFLGGAPEIYINDKKVQDYSVVENLPVSQIKEVKVIHHPGAEYGSDVGCVLLITTKRNLRGLAFTENSGVIIDRYVNNHHDLDLTYATCRVSFYGKMGYSNYQSYLKETYTTTHYAPDGHTYLSSSTLDYRHGYADNFHWSAGMDFSPTSRHTIGVKYDGYCSKQPMPYRMTSYAESDGRRDDEVAGDNKFLYDNWQHHVNAFYSGQWGEKWKFALFGDFVKLHTEQGQTVDEVDGTGSSNAFRLLPQSDGTVWGAKARFNYTVSDKQTLLFGGEYNDVKSESRVDYIPADHGNNTHSITTEDHSAVFAEYAIDFKPFSLRVGLRYEHVESRLDHVTSPELSIRRTYDNLYPSLSLSHTSGRFSQTLSYRSNERRPTFQELNTGTVYVNRYLRQVGNASLEPSQRHEIQYQMTYRDLFLQASYTYAKDYIISVIDPNEKNPQAGYITWTNIDHCRNWGTFLGYRHRWGWYEPQIQTGIQQGFVKTKYKDAARSFHDPYYIFNLHNGFHLPKGWYMNLSYNYRSKGTFDYMKVRSVNTFDFQFDKTFLKDRLSVNIKVTDLFNTISQGSEGTYGNIHVEQRKEEYTRSVQLSLTYRFHQAKKQYQGENTAEEAVGRM